MRNPELLTHEYIDACRHPAIQRMKPQPQASDLIWTVANRLALGTEVDCTAGARTEQVWLPTLEELLSILREKSVAPNEPQLRPCEAGWECTITLSEWTADYGTFVEVQRRFVGTHLKLVVLDALKAAIGIGERLMVGSQ